MILIRPEASHEHDTVHGLVVEAFANSDYGHSGEAELVDLIRESCDDVLSLVATKENLIVGHILFSPVSLVTSTGMRHGMGLAPMAVSPGHQRTGVGSALVENGLKQLASNGCPFVVVLGHPDYYPRFGFRPGSQHGLSHGFAGIPQDVFFVNILDPDSDNSISDGLVSYRPEFGSQRQDQN